MLPGYRPSHEYVLRFDERWHKPPLQSLQLILLLHSLRMKLHPVFSPLINLMYPIFEDLLVLLWQPLLIKLVKIEFEQSLLRIQRTPHQAPLAGRPVHPVIHLTGQ